MSGTAVSISFPQYFHYNGILLICYYWDFSFFTGVNFTARSRPFAILPVTRSESSTIILAASLCSVVSWLALCCLVCCWFKKSKSRSTLIYFFFGMKRLGKMPSCITYIFFFPQREIFMNLSNILNHMEPNCSIHTVEIRIA